VALPEPVGEILGTLQFQDDELRNLPNECAGDSDYASPTGLVIIGNQNHLAPAEGFGE